MATNQKGFVSVFEEIRTKKGYTPNASIQWFRSNLGKLKLQPGDKRLLKDQENLVTRVMPGYLYMYVYDPITADTLPYYDMFPLSFVFRVTNKGWYGINFHYLPLKSRVLLLDRMLHIANSTQYDETTKLKLNWQILSSASRFPMIRPAVKQYLKSQVRSRILRVSLEDAKIALMLPVENFKGASKQTVWQNSAAEMRKV